MKTIAIALVLMASTAGTASAQEVEFCLVAGNGNVNRCYTNLRSCQNAIRGRPYHTCVAMPA